MRTLLVVLVAALLMPLASADAKKPLRKPKHGIQLRPAPYTGRTPHIHFKVKLEGRELLTTQLYVAGDPNNERVDTIARAYAAGTCPPLFCGQSGAPDDPVVVPTATTLPPWSVSETPARPHAPARAPGRAYYVSIVHGTAALDTNWPACAARVRGVSGAQYRKVRTPEELAAFCAAHGVAPPQSLA